MLKEILTGKFNQSSKILKERLSILFQNKIDEMKKSLKKIVEGNILRQGRIELIRRRIRNGKLQKNIKRPVAKGFTVRGGKLTRIPAAKLIRLKIIQKRAARKRRVKMAQSLRKRKISIKKRSALGLKEHYNGLRDNK